MKKDFLIVLGLWIMGDGIISILWFQGQPLFPHQALRLLRVLIGFAVVGVGFEFHKLDWMENEDVRDLFLFGLITLSVFLFLNYKPPSVQASNFFGAYAGSVVLLGIPINHEFVGIGLILSPPIVESDKIRLGGLVSLVIGVFLLISDVPGLTTTPVPSAVLSVVIGAVYGILFWVVLPQNLDIK